MAKQVFIDGIISDFLYEDVKYQIENIKDKEIDVFVSSYGGSVDAGFKIAQYLEGVNKDITTHILGSVDSAATIVFLAGKHRKAVASSRFLGHNPFYSVMFANLGEDDAKQMASQLEFQKNRIISYYVEKIPNATRDEIINNMENETFISADEMLELGIIDEIVQNFNIATYNNLILNYKSNFTQMFGKNKKEKKEAVNIINLDNIQAVYSGELAIGVELTPIGEVETLEGVYDFGENQSISIDNENKVISIEAKKANADEGVKPEVFDEVVAQFTEQVNEIVGKLAGDLKDLSDRIQNIEKSTKSTGKPEKRNVNNEKSINNFSKQEFIEARQSIVNEKLAEIRKKVEAKRDGKTIQ